MNKLLSVALGIALFISCTKDSNTTEVGFVKRVSTSTPGINHRADVIEIAYDNRNRVTALNTFSSDTSGGAVTADNFRNYFFRYKDKDLKPYSATQTNYGLSYSTTILEHYYTYDSVGRISSDSIYRPSQTNGVYDVIVFKYAPGLVAAIAHGCEADSLFYDSNEMVKDFTETQCSRYYNKGGSQGSAVLNPLYFLNVREIVFPYFSSTGNLFYNKYVPVKRSQVSLGGPPNQPLEETFTSETDANGKLVKVLSGGIINYTRPGIIRYEY